MHTLITTNVGKYVWYHELSVIDFIPAGKRKAQFSIVLSAKQNTELCATIVAANSLKEVLKSITS